MANKVSFIVQMKDQFTAVGKKLNKTLAGTNVKVDKLDKSLSKKLNKSLKVSKNKTKDLSGTVKKDLGGSLTTADAKVDEIAKSLGAVDKKAGKLDNTLNGRLKRSLGGVNNKAKNLNSTLKGKLNLSLTGMQKKALSAAKDFITLGTAVATIRIGAGFEDAVAELSAITGAEGANLRALSQDVLRLSRSFGISQEIVASAFTQTASAKSELLKTPGAVATVTTEALRLSKAAGIEVPDAIRASIGALNQWGVGAEQAAKFVNVIAAGAKVGASQVGETAEALKNAGTVAAQFGLTFEETNAILQVFAKNEVKAAEAGTGLRSTLSKLEKFQRGAFAPSRIGIIKSLEAIEKLGLSNSQVIKEFGEENLRSVLILRKNIPLVKQWTKELTGTTVAVKQADIRLSTFNATISKAGTSLKSIAIKVFTGFEPILTRVVKLFTFLINSIEGVTSALGEMLGQGLGALLNFDFRQFDFKGIASSFGQAFGEQKIPIGVSSTAAIDALNAKFRSAGNPTFQAPSAPNGQLNGQITVAAAPGTEIRDTKLKTEGPGLNIGMNMAVAN